MPWNILVKTLQPLRTSQFCYSMLILSSRYNDLYVDFLIRCMQLILNAEILRRYKSPAIRKPAMVSATM